MLTAVLRAQLMLSSYAPVAAARLLLPKLRRHATTATLSAAATPAAVMTCSVDSVFQKHLARPLAAAKPSSEVTPFFAPSHASAWNMKGTTGVRPADGAKSNIKALIRHHHGNPRLHVCAVEGCEKEATRGAHVAVQMFNAVAAGVAPFCASCNHWRLTEKMQRGVVPPMRLKPHAPLLLFNDREPWLSYIAAAKPPCVPAELLERPLVLRAEGGDEGDRGSDGQGGADGCPAATVSVLVQQQGGERAVASAA